MNSNQRQFAKMLLTTQNAPRLEYNEETGACRYKHSYVRVWVSFDDLSECVELSTNIYKFIPKSQRVELDTDTRPKKNNGNNNNNNNNNKDEDENPEEEEEEEENDEENPDEDEIDELIAVAREGVLDLRDQDDQDAQDDPDLAEKIQWDPEDVRIEWYGDTDQDYTNQLMIHQTWPLSVLWNEVDFQDMAKKFIDLYYATRNKVIDAQTGQPIEEMQMHRVWLINKRMSWLYKRRQRMKRRAQLQQEREERQQRREEEAKLRGEKLGEDEDLELGKPEPKPARRGWFFGWGGNSSNTSHPDPVNEYEIEGGGKAEQGGFMYEDPLEPIKPRKSRSIQPTTI